MHGHRLPFRPGSRGRQPPQPTSSQPPQCPPLNLNPNFAFQDPNIALQNLANALLQNYPIQQNLNNSNNFLLHQNPNFLIQSPNFPTQIPNFRPPPQLFPNNIPHRQPPNPQPVKENPNPVAESSKPDTESPKPITVNLEPVQQSPVFMKQHGKLKLKTLERAVDKAMSELLASGESISAWKVAQMAQVVLEVDSWASLEFNKMKEVPALQRIIITEGKINSFIHCFVGVRRITTVYDLEVAICENEGVEKFEELGLGPLLKHPLVLHYFVLNPAVTEVFKITSEEIILDLDEYIVNCKRGTVSIDLFLDFLAKKRSVVGKKLLGVRIQSLGMHISFIQEAKGSENATLKKCKESITKRSDCKFGEVKGSRDGVLKKCQEALASKSNRKNRKRPLLSSLKKDLDERFSAVRERVESFSSAHKDFCGKHIRFVSSSSEDEESGGSSYEDNVNSSDRVSSCPYPSATEEMSRLGLKGEKGCQSFAASDRTRHNESNVPFRKKRKLEDVGHSISVPSKLRKGDRGKLNDHFIESGNNSEDVNTVSDTDISLSNDFMREFITTWKEACREHAVDEVLERMLQFYIPADSKKAARQRKNIKSMFSSYPFIGLLNVALKSIKRGMWDSIYDTFQAMTQFESTKNLSPKCSEYETIDVEPDEKQAPVISEHSVQQAHGATVEEIIGRVTRYYELDHQRQSNGQSLLGKKIFSLEKLCSCELWLVDEFGVKEFKSLGYGEFYSFLENYASLLPTELQKLLVDNTCERSLLQVSLQQNQLIVLVSQASNSLWENETVTKQMISALLSRQFPLLSLKIMANSSVEDFLQIVEKYKNDVISKCVLFSATLLGVHHVGNSLPHKEDYMVEPTDVRTNSGQKMVAFESVTSKDAIEVLLRAPMLSDLISWSHWDLVFAPSLGPLVGWLLSEVNTKELLCVVTKEGSVIRIDQSATADSFLEAALQKSPFQTAVKLLSVFSLAGGENHVPLSLLKCYAHHAFEVILKNHSEDVEVQKNRNSLLHEKAIDGVANSNLSGELQKNLIKMNQAVASRFVLDCLGYMPSEFHGFAIDVLLSGMQSIIKGAPSAILCECNEKERLMLHEIGMSVGIGDWIDDYHTFYSAGTTDVCMSSRSSCLEAATSELNSDSRINQTALDKFSCVESATNVTFGDDVYNEECTKVSSMVDGSVVCVDGIGSVCTEQLSDADKHEAAALVIESIRREEFGLDPSLSCLESNMLKKQHARLGRALHCLSQELYSQDSHFILELIQNADDNIYPENVEPTLTFILQESGIVVLNNEQGFSAQNIKALCDVGNSTKTGSGGGYIGQKGIGFKSVFRVTDSPEIHSNGFHIKFDKSKDQIGFVLPTMVPPCNINLFSRLVCRDTDQMDNKCWKTCIVLPFRSKLSAQTAMEMFSDLHPSLLLFLHRLQCIMFRNKLNDSLIVMRKENLEDGIVRVSCGKDKMTWLVASQKLQAHASRPKVQTTEIAIAFTLEESENGDYNPHLDQQPVFAFLPLRTYGLKFILQGDFILPSSREEVDRNNPWNEWLLTKFPSLFISAERSFCSLSCFRENPGKAVTTYMSFVPLVGEVHGFFSGLPKAIALELRRTSCLLLEGDNGKMVPPCKVLRGWDEQARNLLPDNLLQEHLGLGFLDKNIVLSDSLARALGILEYGPEVLIKFMTYLCCTENGLKSMGFGWLCSWLNTLYTMLSHPPEKTDLIDDLRRIPFIPLSDGTYSSVDVGTIWLHSDAWFGGAQGLEAFPKLFAKLRTVNPLLLSASAVDGTSVDNITGLLHRIGVQQLSAHEIVKVHVLQALSDEKVTNSDNNLIIDYLCFVMIHLQSSCHSCCAERMHIISELKNKAYVLTNHGFKRPVETSIHFSKEFGNPFDVNKLINVGDMIWHEVDISYLKHPANKSLSSGLMKWREFFQEIGVTDFVQVVQIDKSVADLPHTIFKNRAWDVDLISPGSMVRDWESNELVHLLSLLSTRSDGEQCKYLLEVLDMLWDDSFSDKVTGYYSLKSSDCGKTFKSSFISKICDVQWVVSSMDAKLHFPKDLFYDCDVVRSVLGASAPYALPKVRSGKLVSDIGFKTEVTINDALEILGVWRKSKTPFKACIAEMSKLYTFIWDEMAASRNKISEAFQSGPFIFVPSESCARSEDLVTGVFLSAEQVYWHDPTGSVDQMKDIHPHCRSRNVVQLPLSKTLCHIYPGLHDFFVNECGVRESPSCRSYLYILQQLSAVTLPSQSASAVFQVFLKWTEGLKSGLLSSEDIIHLKECLVKVEYTVLPTVLDKWVSLHPSFGLVCWCDDTKLRKRFKHLDNIDFLHFGNLSDDEQEMLQTKVSVLMQKLGIPALSEVMIREAICYGPTDASFKASLINWALPYAQRYIYGVHPDKYFQLKQSGFNNLKVLQIIVVEKLFYKNVIKNYGIASKKEYECSCLLQGNNLYTTLKSESHALFLELSRLFFDGNPQLHLANFLHMISTMAESGSATQQIESFIVNSQKVPKLPDEESVWSLSSIPSSTDNNKSPEIGVASTALSGQIASNSKCKATAQGFDLAHANCVKTQAAISHPSSSNKMSEDNSKDTVIQTNNMVPSQIDINWTIEEGTVAFISPDSENVDNHFAYASNQNRNMDIACDPVDLNLVSDGPDLSSSKFFKRDQLNTGTVNVTQALHTGKLGEQAAFKYLSEKFGKVVKWVNRYIETGLPYDIIVGEDESSREYIEVKATKSARKDWFNISIREWQFAVEKGESFSVAHVVLLGNNTARVTMFRNPVKQCQLGKLQLVLMMPKQQKEFSIAT